MRSVAPLSAAERNASAPFVRSPNERARRPALDTGRPAPLGSHWDGRGVNFAVYSRHAQRIDLCLFDASGTREIARLRLPSRTGDVWHGYLPDAGPGFVYGYRAHGPYAPRDGHRFNAHKLLLDPYARALAGSFRWHDALYGHASSTGAQAGSAPDTRDSAPYVQKARVVAPLPARDGRPPRPHTPWSDTVLYELNVRGFSLQHPRIAPPVRGTLAGLGTPAAIEHLLALGVTAIELLPSAAFIDEASLAQQGLRNYWGYNPLALLAPHRRYLAHDDDAGEFARAVDALHAAGIEVILDIVLNHTAERGAAGPTLSLRGLDNATYYRAEPGHPERYADYARCGNTLDLSQPAAVALAHAALRYWACEIGVDGFRFDLAATMMRDRDGHFDAHAPLARAIANDADLAPLKLIAEPWDLGEPGYFLGAFPAPFAEWNDRYRDGVRRFWRGEPGLRGECATRIAGSSDLFAASGRSPWASIDFVASHDGLTLADLTACDHALDAPPEAAPPPHGVDEGADDATLARRARHRASLLGTLLLSHGTPMLLAGDELSRSQHGLANAYCHDSPVSWLDWSALGDPRRDLSPFVRRAIALRRCAPLVRQARFFDGQPIAGRDGDKDVAWLRPDGREMRVDDWNDREARAFAALFVDPAPVAGGVERLYLALNPGDAPQSFCAPHGRRDGARAWIVALDSAHIAAQAAVTLDAGSPFEVPGRGFVALVPFDTRVLDVPAHSRPEQAAGC